MSFRLLQICRLKPFGDIAGGIQWGPAADTDTIYVALSDVRLGVKAGPEREAVLEPDAKAGGGLFVYRSEKETRHYDIYGGETLDQVMQLEIVFFDKHLKGQTE